MIDFGFDAFHDARVENILGGNREDEGLEGFGSGFESERLVNRGESALRLDGDVEIHACSFIGLLVCHIIIGVALLVG